MKYKHPAPPRPTQATGKNRSPVAIFAAISVLLMRRVLPDPLLSNDDKSRLTRHIKGITAILRDLGQRSQLTEDSKVTRESPDSSMRQMLDHDKDTITAYAGSMIQIAERLWLNNRMSEERYQQLKALYAQLPRLHDEVRAEMERAREPGT